MNYSSSLVTGVRSIDCVPASIVSAVSLMLGKVAAEIVIDKFKSTAMKCKNLCGTRRSLRSLKMRLDLKVHPER